MTEYTEYDPEKQPESFKTLPEEFNKEPFVIFRGTAYAVIDEDGDTVSVEESKDSAEEVAEEFTAIIKEVFFIKAVIQRPDPVPGGLF